MICEDCDIDWSAYKECPTPWHHCPSCSGKLNERPYDPDRDAGDE